MIFFSYPKAGFEKYSSEIKEAIDRVLNSGIYIKGESLKNFENNFSRYLGCKFGLGVASGTDSIFLSLKAIGVKEDDEVLTVSHTATGTVAAIVHTGASPVFLDIKEETMNLDSSKIENSITKKTKAIIAVHLYGQACDMDPILDISKKYGIPVIEDCAQAAGAEYKGNKVGSMGVAGCFSFFPTKNLSGYGDGGFVATSDKDIYQKIIAMREYGWDEKRDAFTFGINSRLDEMQAAVLDVKLSHLEEDNEERIRAANFYLKNIKNDLITLPICIEHSKHVYHLFVVKIVRRDDFINHLKDFDIVAGIHYPNPVHQHSYYQKFLKKSTLPLTDKTSKEIVSIPIYQGIKQEELDKVVSIINKFV